MKLKEAGAVCLNRGLILQKRKKLGEGWGICKLSFKKFSKG